MIITKSRLSKYTIRKQGDFYVFSDYNKDVFYYNYKTLYNMYPYKLSVEYTYFQDMYMDYIMWKLMWTNMSEDKEKKYLILFFKRLSSYNEFDDFQLNSRSLDKNGRLNIHAHNYYIKHYYDIQENLPSYISASKPYFRGQSKLIFNYIERQSYYDEIDKECDQIFRYHFEAQLSNFELGLAYVELYSKENEYFSRQIDEDSDLFGLFSYCYYLFKNKKLELCFFV
jgi:hypothetical protein